MVKSKIKGQKKGQMIGQAFIFILAAILFSLILLFGYRAIARIGETQAEIELIDFRDGLSSAVGKIRLDYGSVKKYAMNIPGDYREMCFVDLEQMRDLGTFESFKNSRPLMADSVESGNFDPANDQNVFTVPIAKTPIRIGAIAVEDTRGYLCIPNKGGTINLRLEGKGDKTGISLWPET